MSTPENNVPEDPLSEPPDPEKPIVSENPDSENVENSEGQSPPKKKARSEPKSKRKKADKTVKNEDIEFNLDDKIIEQFKPEMPGLDQVPILDQELVWFTQDPNTKNCEIVTSNNINIQIEQSIQPMLDGFMKNQFPGTKVPSETMNPNKFRRNLMRKCKHPEFKNVYKCDYPNNCKKEFAFLSNLEIHVAKVHDTVLEYCTLCPNNAKHGFTQHESLIDHIEENHEYTVSQRKLCNFKSKFHD